MKHFYTLILLFVVLIIIYLYQKDMFEDINVINFNCSAQPSTQLITPNPVYCSNPKACLRYRSSLTPMPS